MRKELTELRESIETKQQATAKVKEGLGRTALQGMTGGVATGVIAAGEEFAHRCERYANECSSSCSSALQRDVNRIQEK